MYRKIPSPERLAAQGLQKSTYKNLIRENPCNDICVLKIYKYERKYHSCILSFPWPPPTGGTPKAIELDQTTTAIDRQAHDPLCLKPKISKKLTQKRMYRKIQNPASLTQQGLQKATYRNLFQMKPCNDFVLADGVVI